MSLTPSQAPSHNAIPLTARGIALIRRFEGFEPSPYRCPAGYLTIGYGHRIGPGEHFPHPLTVEEATALLIEDASRLWQRVARRITVPLHPLMRDALVSLVYNIGPAAFSASTLLKELNRAHHEEVLVQFLRWRFVGKTPMRGLEARRKAEAALYREGWNLSEKSSPAQNHRDKN
jgi:lysozyme